MKIINNKDLPQQGKLILIYGNTGAGKSTSISQSAPCPILYFATEPRNPTPSIEASGREHLDMDVARYSTWFDLMEFLQNPKNTERYSTIVIDSITYLMNISLSGEIGDESFDARSLEEKKRRPIVSQAKMSMEGYGGLASQMFRLMKAIGRGTRSMTPLLKTTGWYVWSGEAKDSSAAWYYNFIYGGRYSSFYNDGRGKSRAFAVRSRK